MLFSKYDENPSRSIIDLAREVGCCQQTANTYLLESGRDTSRKRFRKNFHYLDSDGYVVLYQPENPAAKADGRIREHVAVATKALGRPLKQNEVVHRINGNKTDNRNSNLLICTKSYHSMLHWKMSDKYAKEHFTN